MKPITINLIELWTTEPLFISTIYFGKRFGEIQHSFTEEVNVLSYWNGLRHVPFIDWPRDLDWTCDRQTARSLTCNNLKKNKHDIFRTVFAVFSDNYSATRLTVARPNKLFLQVSQSGYANFINGYASLQSPTGWDATTNYWKHVVLYFMANL